MSSSIKYAASKLPIRYIKGKYLFKQYRPLLYLRHNILSHTEFIKKSYAKNDSAAN